MTVRYRKAIRLINNALRGKIKESVYIKGDTFVFMGFEALYSALILDSPQADYVFPKTSALLYTTDPGQFAQILTPPELTYSITTVGQGKPMV